MVKFTDQIGYRARAREAMPAYKLRGAALAAYRYDGHEWMLSGPAETGKSIAACYKLNRMLWDHPGARAIVARKKQTDLYGTILRTYERVSGISAGDSPIKAYGGQKPEWYQYPNGSRLAIVGMDNPGKVLSGEYDYIYLNQAEEFALNDYETLVTRCTGRGAVVSNTQIMGDCNPGPPTHWIKNRPSLKLFESRHEDNPTLFDDDGNITEQGVKSLAYLDTLTGVRYHRLRKGLWVAAEGVVYEGYDPAVHLISSRDPRYGLQNGIPNDWSRIWTVDFGYIHPFVWQDWAIDPDGRLHLCREIYKTQTLTEDHAKRILELTRDEPKPSAIICDHDAEDRATLEKYLGMRTIPATKTVLDGIQAVASRLRLQGDGKPRILFHNDALDEVDSTLKREYKPICSAQEFEVYIWDTSTSKRPKEEPVKKLDDGMDAMRYGVAHFDLPVASKIPAARPMYAAVSTSGRLRTF